MATMQDRETFGRARLSFAKEADIDEFVSLLARFESGESAPTNGARSGCCAAPTGSGRRAMRR